MAMKWEKRRLYSILIFKIQQIFQHIHTKNENNCLVLKLGDHIVWHRYRISVDYSQITSGGRFSHNYFSSRVCQLVTFECYGLVILVHFPCNNLPLSGFLKEIMNFITVRYRQKTKLPRDPCLASFSSRTFIKSISPCKICSRVSQKSELRDDLSVALRISFWNTCCCSQLEAHWSGDF